LDVIPDADALALIFDGLNCSEHVKILTSTLTTTTTTTNFVEATSKPVQHQSITGTSQCSVNQLSEQLKLRHQSIIMHVTGYQQQCQSFISDYLQLELAINTSYI
jgi:hypothetical protein